MWQALANGLMAGSIYGLMAMGLALIFGVLHIPQFALGAHAMIGAYIVVVGTNILGLGFWVSTFAAVVVGWALGYAVQRLVFDPLRDAPPINMFIAAFGLLLVLQSLAQLIWGTGYHRIEPPIDGRLQVGPVFLTAHRLLIVLATVAVASAIYWFINRTNFGLKLRAASSNDFAASIVGLDAVSLGRKAMGLGGVLATIAGVLLGPVAQVFPHMGDLLIIKAFVVVILAGMGSIMGALVGGYVLGISEALGGTYISLAYQDAFGFLLLVIVLAIRPSGLFGKGLERV